MTLLGFSRPFVFAIADVASIVFGTLSKLRECRSAERTKNLRLVGVC